MYDPTQQSKIMGLVHKPVRMRLIQWNGMPFRDRWLMIAPILPGPNGPVAAPDSEIGLITNGDNLLAPIQKGQVCLYDDKSRQVQIVDNVQRVLQQYEIVGEISQ